MELGVLDILSAGGDFGIWAAVALLWRFDRRIVRLEIEAGFSE